MRTLLALAVVAACTTTPNPSGGPHPLALDGSDPHADGCGNGICEPGETHASCPTDCCEPDASGSCVTACGNGFCEDSEDHASCPADCCEVDANGYCEPVCGN